MARAVEGVKMVSGILEELAEPGREPNYEFFTTGSDLDEFRRFGSRVLQMSMTSVSHVDL